MAASIREVAAKRMLSGVSRVTPVSVLGVSERNVGEIESLSGDPSYKWLFSKPLVYKPDVLLKRRGTSGLVKLNVSIEQVLEDLRGGVLGKTIVQEGVEGALTHFIVEPFFPHDQNTQEFYIAIRTLRHGDQILFSPKGGINVGDVEQNTYKINIPLNSKLTTDLLPPLIHKVQEEKVRLCLEEFIVSLYERFCTYHFAYLEINPFCYDEGSDSIVLLDAAAKVDHTAGFVCEGMWSRVDFSSHASSTKASSTTTSPDSVERTTQGLGLEFPSPFGRELSSHEMYIRELDSKTGASLKLTILNPKGRIWTMIAGGGASVVYSDTLCDYGEAGELANYGEYSGAPSELTTYEYAKTVLSLLCTHHREEGKILLIGGGIANFTSVASTFKGIIKALREFGSKLVEHKVRIYVRRGGPSYQDGLKLMANLGQELNIPIQVFGPDTYITAIIPIALAEDKEGNIPAYGWEPICNAIEEKMKLNLQKNDTEKNQSEKNKNLKNHENKENSALNSAIARLRAAPTKSAPPLFERDTCCFVWGLQIRAVQEMLDFDHVCGRKRHSVCALIYEFSVSHLRPFYFGTEEVFIPVCQSLGEAVGKFPEVNTLVNFASMRSAYDVTVSAMNYPTICTVAVIAEGVPERFARDLRQRGLEKGVQIIGPATVGGMRSGCFRVGNTGGSLENIMNAKLYRPGSVGFVTKSGGMLNELNNVLSIVADGAAEGVAIGGDRFPGTSMLDHILRFEADEQIKMMVLLGEVGGDVEYEVAAALKLGLIKKPLVAWCVGTCADRFSTEVSFGHAGAWAGSNAEQAREKNMVLQSVGAITPPSFQQLGLCIKQTYEKLIQNKLLTRLIEPDAPRVPMDYAWAKKLGLVRRPKGFISSISDDRGEELVYAGWPISKVLKSDMGIGGVIALLWFKRPMPDYCYRYLEQVLMLTADHGPAVCGAHNTIVAARAGKDLISSLIAGLCTIGDRFGGACDQAAQQFYEAFRSSLSPHEFVKTAKANNKLIMGIGHRIKSVHNPDMRVQLLREFCKANFQQHPLIDFAEQVEKVTTKKKDTLILNVDGLIGVSMCDLLFHCGVFTENEAQDYIDNGCINGLFVLGRSIGFIGHFLDQKRLKQGLYRHDVDDIAYVLPELSHSL